MAIALSPYDVVVYNSTPLLNVALQKHQAAGGNGWIHDTFSNLFRQYHVEDVLGLILLHNHFPLEENEYLTEVHGTSTAWKSQTGNTPSCWALNHDNRTIEPIEFSLDDDDHSVPYPEWGSENMQLFLEKLMVTLEKYGVAGIYGLGRYPGDGYPGRVEMTVGRSNVNLTPKQVCRVEILHTIYTNSNQAAKHAPAVQSEAAWFFTEDFTKIGCACNCYHHGTGNSTHSHHTTVNA